MKLKSFNPENIPQNARQGVPKVSMNLKSGTITFTKTAGYLLSFFRTNRSLLIGI